MTIDTSLDNLILPALPTYDNEFGTKKMDGGLTTAECVDGMIRWARQQRPLPVTETSTTTKVDANCTFDVTTAGVELTIADASFNGCKATVINSSDGDISVKGGVSGLNGLSRPVVIPSKEMMTFTFYSGWHSDILSQYPKGQLVWFSIEIDPNVRFGGTWVQIKDKFILAAGDTYNADETGGNADTALTTANLPSHTHGLNGHTHSFSAITGKMSDNSSGYTGVGDRNENGANRCTKPFSYKYHVNGNTRQFAPSTDADAYDLYMDISHTHTVSGTTVGASGSTTPTGSGTAFSNMPPYVVKYCWERVA